MRLIRKAYEVDLSRIKEGYCYCEQVCYAKNRNEAKTILLKDCDVQDMSLCYSDDYEYVTYLNIPVIRCKRYDKFLFEGEELTVDEIGELKRKRKRNESLNVLLNDSSVTHCYIKKGAYYRPGSCGYTDFLSRAGVYNKDDAVSHARGCDEITLVPINVDEHNKLIESEIADLKTRIINSKS